MEWQLQDAKNRFSEVVERACRSGPQVVKRRGKRTAVVLSIEDYRKLTQRQTGLIDFLRRSPLVGVELDLKRNQDSSREAVL